MYVEEFRNNKEPSDNKLIPTERRLPPGTVLKKLPSGVVMHWQAPEYETFEKDRTWYAIISLLLVSVIGYAIYTDSPIMAITFILIGVVGYIFLNRDPRLMDFAITHQGIIAGREIYEFENIQSFWIFYEPHDIKVISLHTKNRLLPFVHIPIHQENPLEVRNFLLEYIPEIKQEPSLVDTFERILKI